MSLGFTTLEITTIFSRLFSRKRITLLLFQYKNKNDDKDSENVEFTTILLGFVRKMLHLFGVVIGKNHMVYLGCPGWLLCVYLPRIHASYEKGSGIFIDWSRCDV